MLFSETRGQMEIRVFGRNVNILGYNVSDPDSFGSRIRVWIQQAKILPPRKEKKFRTSIFEEPERLL
jgi:hypothetical protein